MEKNHVEMKKIVGKLEGSLVGMNKRVNEKVEALKECHDELKRDQREVRNEVKEVKKEVKDVKENLSKVNKDVDEMKVMMSLMLERFSTVELMMNRLPSLTQDMLNTPTKDILITGYGDSADIFSRETSVRYEVAEMNEEHCGASSFIYNDQLFVVGGCTKTIETIDLTELPLKWMEFPEELPYEIYGETVLYQQRVIHIGGYNEDEEKVSNLISELQLTSPCTMKELCQMPEPRAGHGTEAFEDKVLILGGEDDGDDNVVDSVLEFDPEKNECHEIASLPHPLAGMSTVRWRDQVVVLGGVDKDNEVRNDVCMYDSKTGKTTTLPSMLKKRMFWCAVVTGNTIVVMGGSFHGADADDDCDSYDSDADCYDHSSVECFTMGGSTWKYLPSMSQGRSWAVAEFLPSTRKYVYV